MNACPFCGSPAAQWPEFASDYIRGYTLCEYHMSFVIKKALRQEFNAPKHFDAIKYNKMYEALTDFIEDLYNENIRQDSMGEIISDYGYCLVAEKFYRDVLSGIDRQPLVDPTKEYLNESSVDEWVAQRLKSLAHEKDGRIYRCSAYIKEKPDNRCTNRSYAQGELCEKCQDNKVKNRIGGLDDPKIIAALEILRSTSENKQIAA
jgi:hypothetical protein